MRRRTRAASVVEGHFPLESGHHGELWLTSRAVSAVNPVKRLAIELADRLSAHSVEAICGPLVEGAFVGLLVASTLDLPFTYAEPRPSPQANRSYPVQYRIPDVLRREVRGKRVAIVNDVINMGSAVRGAFTDLEACVPCCRNRLARCSVPGRTNLPQASE